MQITSRKKKQTMKIQVVLKLSSRSNAQILIDGQHYVVCMTGNPYFAAEEDVALVATCKGSITGLSTAVNAPISETKTDVIKIGRDKVDRNLTMLGARVEEVANDPSIPDSQREEIAHSAGMETKTSPQPKTRVFSVRNTRVSGVVYLIAKGRAKAHEWQYTTDVINFTGRIAANSTSQANTTIPGLKKGTEYAFFHKAIMAKGETDWEGPILLIVT
jgi:hypothetical protein